MPAGGSVFGSGSNAGAGGTPGEDYDSDTAGGGTKPDDKVVDATFEEVDDKKNDKKSA